MALILPSRLDPPLRFLLRLPPLMMRRFQRWMGPGPSAMILAGLFFSGMASLVKLIGQSHFSVFQIIFFRAGVAAVIIAIMTLKRGVPLWGENHGMLLVRSIAGCIAMGLNFYAISKINLGDASVLNQSSPFFVMIFSWLFLGEKFYYPLLFLTLVSFIGIILVLHPSGQLLDPAALAGLGSAFFAALAYVAIRHLHKTDSFWTMAFYFMAVAAGLSLLPMLYTWKTPSLVETAILALTGLLGTFGQLLMTYAYKHEEASWVAPFSYMGVLFSFIFGLFFGEIPNGWTILGVVLSVGSGILILQVKNKLSASSTPNLAASPETESAAFSPSFKQARPSARGDISNRSARGGSSKDGSDRFETRGF